MLEKLISLLSRVFFLVALVLLGLGVMERIAFAAHYKFLLVGPFTGMRLLEIAVVLLIFVIAVQLREIKEELRKRRP